MRSFFSNYKVQVWLNYNSVLTRNAAACFFSPPLGLLFGGGRQARQEGLDEENRDGNSLRRGTCIVLGALALEGISQDFNASKGDATLDTRNGNRKPMFGGKYVNSAVGERGKINCSSNDAYINCS